MVTEDLSLGKDVKELTAEWASHIVSIHSDYQRTLTIPGCSERLDVGDKY